MQYHAQEPLQHLCESAKERIVFTAASAQESGCPPALIEEKISHASARFLLAEACVGPSLSIECALHHIEGLSFIDSMVAEEQIGPNLRCGVSRNPIFLSKIIQNGVSATVSKHQLQARSASGPVSPPIATTRPPSRHVVSLTTQLIYEASNVADLNALGDRKIPMPHGRLSEEVCLFRPLEVTVHISWIRSHVHANRSLTICEEQID